MVVECSFSNRMAACIRALKTFACSDSKCVLLFWSEIAHLAMRSVVDRTVSDGGKRYVTSVMLSGNSGCAPVAAK